ncbi:MAG TPA: type II secretion system protein [Desulfotomaculum sp.]|nr:type II secretion system protein [Desulfotomaculum sp.]
MRVRANERGLTLLEVLVAAVVLGIIAVGLFTAFGVGTRLAAGAREQVKAVNLARERMEELRGVAYGELEHHATSGEAEFEPTVPGFTYRVSVTDSGANVKTVTVAVYYTVAGPTKEVNLTMERAKL